MAAIPVATAEVYALEENVDDRLPVVELTAVAEAEYGRQNPNAIGTTNRRESRPRFVSVAFRKQEVEESIGITLRSSNNAVSVAAIAPDSVLHEAPIAKNDRLISINGIDCREKSVWWCTKHLKMAPSVVTLVLETPEEEGSLDKTWNFIIKPTVDEPVGITLLDNGGELLVSKLGPGSYLEKAYLNIGDRVLTVNDSSAATLNSAEAAMLIRTSRTILVETENTTPPGLVSLLVHKDSRDIVNSLRFSQGGDGKLYITASGENSPIQTGDTLLSINGIDVSVATPALAQGFLETGHGWFTFIVGVPGGDSSKLATIVVKRVADAALGIHLRDDGAGGCFVRNLGGDFFRNSLLNVGDQIRSIDGMPVTSVARAEELLKRSGTVVQLVTQKEGSEPAVVAFRSSREYFREKDTSLNICYCAVIVLVVGVIFAGILFG